MHELLLSINELLLLGNKVRGGSIHEDATIKGNASTGISVRREYSIKEYDEKYCIQYALINQAKDMSKCNKRP